MKIEDLLVPVDFSPPSEHGIRFAKSLIGSGKGEIHLLHVVDADFVARAVEEGFGVQDEVTAAMRERAEGLLAELAEKYADEALSINSVVVVGKPFLEILRLAKQLEFEMIVMGMRGRHESVEQALFGSTSERVLRAAPCPVVCVPFAPQD